MDSELAAKLEEHRRLSRLGLVAPTATPEVEDATRRISQKLTELRHRCETSEQFDYLCAIAQIDGMQHFEEKVDGILDGLSSGSLTLDAIDTIRESGGMNRAAKRRWEKLKKKRQRALETQGKKR